MARPRKITDQKKTFRLIVRLNAEERKLVEYAAKNAGLRPYSFARVKILDGRVPKPVLSEIDLGVYLELKKIGVNINQLARVANSGRFPVGITAVFARLIEQQQTIINLLLNDSRSEDR